MSSPAASCLYLLYSSLSQKRIQKSDICRLLCTSNSSTQEATPVLKMYAIQWTALQANLPYFALGIEPRALLLMLLFRSVVATVQQAH